MVIKTNNPILLTNQGTGHFLLSEKKFQPIGKQGIVKKDGTVIKVKTKEEKQITLLDEKGSMSVLNMDAAKKLAEKKKLMLVDVTDEQRDGKSGRRVYQLKTEADALDFKRRSDKVDDKSKTKKMFLIKTNIADNDLESKINIMIRNVSKKHEVRVILTDENKSHNLESVYKKIEEKVQDTCHIKNKARKDQNRLAFELEPFSEKKKEKQKLKQTTAEENKNMDTVNNTKKAEAQS